MQRATRQKVRVMQMPRGNAGTAKTLKIMRALVHQAVVSVQMQEFAYRVVQNVAGHNFAGEICQCFYYVRDGITYRRDPKGVELVKHPRHTIRQGVGDCDDKSILLATLLTILGREVAFVVSSKDGRNWDHVYVAVKHEGRWVALDPTNERAEPGWQVPARKRYAVSALSGKGIGNLAGFWSKVGNAFKKVGKVALAVAPIALAPFTAGGSLALTGVTAGISTGAKIASIASTAATAANKVISAKANNNAAAAAEAQQQALLQQQIQLQAQQMQQQLQQQAPSTGIAASLTANPMLLLGGAAVVLLLLTR